MEAEQQAEVAKTTNALIPEAGDIHEIPSLWLLLRVWFGIGIQSFGGGIATLALIRQAVTERHRWMTDVEFTRDWALVQVAPGINLLALTILIGRRVRGVPGIFVALAGLLLPSVAITLLLTAGYARIRGLAVVQAALRGIVPAIVGLGLLTGAQMARSLLVLSRREGSTSLAVGFLILLGGAFATALWGVPVLLILLLGGVAGALWQWRYAVRKHAEDVSPS
ncbi:MAG TPA: chromate transporter [Chthonomonadaceae bacterium]|nr:chromate transporter [Chthonomonadaceae bacterium]